LQTLGLVRAIAAPLVGPSAGKLTSVPAATVAALFAGINAKKSAKLNKPPAGPAGPVAPAGLNEQRFKTRMQLGQLYLNISKYYITDNDYINPMVI